MTLETENVDAPDEKRSFRHGDLDVVNISGATIGSAGLNPGWKWSNDVKPIASTDSGQAPRTGDVLSARLPVKMDDGAEGAAGPRDASVISLGHNAWAVADEPCLPLDWSGSADHARPAG
jgi:hypothetical protein